MSERDERAYLEHMLDSARKIIGRMQNVDRAEYDANEELRLALAYRLQIIGEAARHVSQATREAHSRIPWRDIVAMRHKVVHEYFRLDEDVLWDVVRDHLPALVFELEAVPGLGETSP